MAAQRGRDAAVEFSQRPQAMVQAAALSAIQKSELSVSAHSAEQEENENTPFSELTFGYSYEELTPDWGDAPTSSLDIPIW